MAHYATRWVLVSTCLLAAISAFAANPEERIAFQRNDPPAVTVMFADGSGMVDLGVNRQFSNPCVTPALSPDGRTLAFSAKVGDQFKIFTWCLDEHNSAISEPKRLTTTGSDLSEKFPAWSPDGKRLAFLTTDRSNKIALCVIGSDGAGMTTLASPDYSASPSWSPDGKQLLYIAQLGDKPVLHNIVCSANAKGLPVHQESRITAACYSPDGKQIAALIQRDNGTHDLYVLRPFGIGGQSVVTNIVGAKGINWRTPGTIVFNAAKVGAQSGKAFWMVSPKGGDLRGVTGYADPKQIAYFSVQKCDLTPYTPVAIDPNLTKKPATETATANHAEQIAAETKLDEQVDMSQILVAHAASILSPIANAKVHGLVPIQLMARTSVPKIALLINGEKVLSTPTSVFGGKVPRLKCAWDTQQFKLTGIGDTFSDSYQDMLRYPDGVYTLCVQALDDNDRVIDQHIVTVTVQNELPDTIIAGGSTTLDYLYRKGMTESFQVHGEGDWLDAQANQQARQLPQLKAVLDAQFKRSVVQVQNDTFAFMTEMGPLANHYPFVFGQSQMSLPEFSAQGAYTINKSGGLSVATIKSTGEKKFLPLSQIAMPLSNFPVRVGDSWTQSMWVVTDMLDREATPVNAVMKLDGFEWINGKQTARIRSEYRVSDNLALQSSPAATPPQARGTRAKQIGQAAIGGNGAVPPPMGTTTATSTNASAITVKKTQGVRYAWYDLSNHTLVRVEDLVLHDLSINTAAPQYTVPNVNGAGAGAGSSRRAFDPRMGMLNRGAPGMSTEELRQARQQESGNKSQPQLTTARYLVHYRYDLLPAPKQTE